MELIMQAINPMVIEDTLDGTSSPVAGALFHWFTKDSGTNNLNGLMIHLDSGYKGTAGLVRVMDIQNYVAGTNQFNLMDTKGTFGASIESQGYSTGDNVGTYSIAGFATGRNIAGYFRALQDSGTTSSKVNIGVMGYAGHYAPIKGNQIGGFFGLFNPYTSTDLRKVLDTTSAALVADNGGNYVPVFLGRVDNVDAFKINNEGRPIIVPRALSNSIDDGKIEFNGTHYFGTIGSERYQFDQQNNFIYKLTYANHLPLSKADSLVIPDKKYVDSVAAAAYGELYEDGGSTAIRVTNAGTYYQWASSSVGTQLRNSGSAVTDNITVSSRGQGVYLVTASVSFTAANNSIITWAVFKNGRRLPNITQESVIGTGVHLASISLTGLVPLAISDVIDLRVTSNNNAEQVTPTYVDISITRISR